MMDSRSNFCEMRFILTLLRLLCSQLPPDFGDKLMLVANGGVEVCNMLELEIIYC